MRIPLMCTLLMAGSSAWAQDPAEPEPTEDATKDRPAEPAPEEAAPEPEAVEVARPEPAQPEVVQAPMPELGAFDATTDIWAELDEAPPKYSYDLAVHAIFGLIPHWTADAPWWPGVGIRGVWGPNFGNARLSIGGMVSAEGPLPEFYLIGIEPQVGLDVINGPIQAGVSGGVGAMFYGRARFTGHESAWGVAPSVAARLGYSDGWTRMGRRFFAVVEPKMRYAEGEVVPSVALVIGSGRGA